MRANGRAADQLRQIRLEPGVNKYAEGSCLAHFGDTQVLCTASVENTVPPFLRNTGRGWVTAEYGMLPRATNTRGNREAARGGQSGRTHEIQRLIGRSLRAVTDLAGFGERQVKIDCDVIQADGGTRTAAITGSYVALGAGLPLSAADRGRRPRCRWAPRSAPSPAASSRGSRCSTSTMTRTARAEADANFVFTGDGGIVEIQGTAEQKPFAEKDFLAMLALARKGCVELAEIQRQALGLG